MYVVKVVAHNGVAEFRTFAALPEALRMLSKRDREFFDEPKSANLFDVPGVSDAKFAVALVEGGKGVFLKRYDVF